MHLVSIEERLNNPKLSIIEKSQREIFCEIVQKIHIENSDEVLSVSCGDGVWDYLAFEKNRCINKIIATDIVECPVDNRDKNILKKLGDWDFVKVEKSNILPFENDKFSFIFHQDVIEHTQTPFFFLKEQHRVLKKGGSILIGTPNLFRPANVIRLLSGRLKFPAKIGFNIRIGEYIHVQEFYEQQLKLMLEEIGFNHIQIVHCYFGLSFTNICFSLYPKSDFGKLFCHILTFCAKK